MLQIPLEKTLDVEVVERQLAELWKQIAGDRESDNDAAVMRARVANLLVCVTNDALLDEVHQMMRELTAIHPSRVLVMLGRKDTENRDVEMSVGSFCQTDKRTGAKRLCCEQITLKAVGKFVVELPSVALPLLVPDLSTFLWWRDEVLVSNKVFNTLLRASDRLVIDSAEFANPSSGLVETHKLFDPKNNFRVGISDLNWARLTLWRGLLADFYDVPAYQPLLDEIDYVRIDYVPPEPETAQVAPQALLMAGWLADRLGWNLLDEKPSQEKHETLSFNFSRKKRGSSPTTRSPTGEPGWSEAVREGFSERGIKVEVNRVERAERKPGRLVQVELRSSGEQPASFVVERSVDGLHIQAEARLGPSVQRGRILPVRNRSAAQLLSREMEILCNDQIYQEAVAMAARMIDRSAFVS